MLLVGRCICSPHSWHRVWLSAVAREIREDRSRKFTFKMMLRASTLSSCIGSNHDGVKNMKYNFTCLEICIDGPRECRRPCDLSYNALLQCTIYSTTITYRALKMSRYLLEPSGMLCFAIWYGFMIQTWVQTEAQTEGIIKPLLPSPQHTKDAPINNQHTPRWVSHLVR